MKPLKRDSAFFRFNMNFGTSQFKQVTYRNDKISLCVLVSSTFMSVMVLLGLLLFLSLALFSCSIVVLSLLSPVMLLTGFIPSFIDIEFLYLFLCVALFIVMLGGFTGVITGEMKILPEYMKRNKTNTPTKPKYRFKDSYIYNYIKSHKDKFCPMIDIE